MGHKVVGMAHDGAELVKLCEQSRPDLVISDIAMPIMDGIEAADRICQQNPVAIVLVSAHYDKRLIQRAQLDYVMAYLVKPVTEVDLVKVISMATLRFEQFQLLRNEAHSFRQALSDRRIVEKAKEIIMQTIGLPEADAFRRLQKMAWQQKKRIVDVAQLMISTTAVGLGPLVTQEPAGVPDAATTPLTSVESDVARFVAQGYSNKEIADHVGCNVETVAVHKAAAMRKLGLDNRAELVRYARSQNWIECD